MFPNSRLIPYYVEGAVAKIPQASNQSEAVMNYFTERWQ